MTFMKVTYLDASVAVKLVCDEDRADVVRAYCREEAPVWITNVCFFESLGVLKRKFDRKELTQPQYFGSFSALLGFVETRFLAVDEIRLEDALLVIEVEDIAKRYGLDMSDALQIHSVKSGRFKGATGPSRTVLATADRTLAAAANGEGLRVWNIMTEPQPPGATV